MKKVLDKWKKLMYNDQVRCERGGRTVPCKLNNAKTNKNTLDNYMDCLRIVYKTNLLTANENS